MNSRKLAVAMARHVLILTVVLGPSAASAAAEQVDGFTQPYRIIDVAAAEAGIITQIEVREGDSVKQGQTVATLDNDVHLALLAIAEKSMNSKGKLDSARAELELQKDRLKRFQALREHGHARQEEVDRTRTEVAIAEGQVTAAQEELAIREMEYRKIVTQLERRVIRSPIDGVIAKRHKDEGEFVAPNSPETFTVVQLDPLLAAFSVMSAQAGKLRTGQEVEVRFAGVGQPAKGTIEFIAPVTDAESGTVLVKVRIDNPDGSYRSGERCSIRLPE
jgi:RND family efflux transporter MFP subunit